MNIDEHYMIKFKACYDAIRYANSIAQTSNQLYLSLLDKFNRYVVISDEVDGRQSQNVSISTVFGTIDPTDTNVKEFTFNSGSVLRYSRVLPFNHTDGLEVVNYQTLINTIQDSAMVFTGDAGPAGVKGDNGVTGAKGDPGAPGTNGASYQDLTTFSTDGTTTTVIIAPTSNTWLTHIDANTIKFNQTGVYEIFGYSLFEISPYDHYVDTITPPTHIITQSTYNIPYPANFTYSGSTVYSGVPFLVTLSNISNNLLIPSAMTLSIKKLA